MGKIKLFPSPTYEVKQPKDPIIPRLPMTGMLVGDLRCDLQDLHCDLQDLRCDLQRKPRVRDLQLSLPSAPGTPGTRKSLHGKDGIAGIALNSVLFVHEHPGEGMTWILDNCGGHGDTFGHYHYHAPPLCLLRSLGVAVPAGDWWKTGGRASWAAQGPEVQVGWALDGAPIMGPYRAGTLANVAELDECHGAIDKATGEYKYYMVLEAPFMPPCLRGTLGNVTGYRGQTGGEACSGQQRRCG
eukprot:s7913_g3.t1